MDFFIFKPVLFHSRGTVSGPRAVHWPLPTGFTAVTALPASPQSMSERGAILLPRRLHALMHWHISQHASEREGGRGWTVMRRVENGVKEGKVRDGAGGEKRKGGGWRNMLNEEEEIRLKTLLWGDSQATAGIRTQASRLFDWRTLCHVNENHTGDAQKKVRVETTGTSLFFFFLSFFLSFPPFLSLFSAAVLFWERRLSPRSAREGGERASEWVSEWMEGWCACAWARVPAWESQAGIKQRDGHTGTYTGCCKLRGTYPQHASACMVRISGKTQIISADHVSHGRIIDLICGAEKFVREWITPKALSGLQLMIVITMDKPVTSSY